MRAMRLVLAATLVAVMIVQTVPATGSNDGNKGASDWSVNAPSVEPGAGDGAADSGVARQENPPRPRKSPPPFDRPPLEPGKQPSPSQPTAPRSAEPAPTRRTVPEANSSGGSSPPELRRPSSSRSREAQPVEAPPSENADETIRLNATLVNIPVLVSDRSGRFISRLTEQDFLVYEDGVLQEVAFFISEEVPIHAALLLDVSPSVAASLHEIQEAALAFVQQMRRQDRIMVVAFDRRIHYLTEFTNNRSELETAIRRTGIGSGTSVYDVVHDAVTLKLSNVDGRKALILFSDGEDTTSRKVNYHQSIDTVMESDVLVYGLRYPSSTGRRPQNPRTGIPDIEIPLPIPWPWPRRRRGTFTNIVPNWQSGQSMSARAQWPGRYPGDFMSDVTSAGGGPVFDAHQVGDLSSLARQIAEELRHVYQVSYYPTNPLTAGGYRALRIRVRGRDDIAVRHRRGYNARETDRAVGR